MRQALSISSIGFELKTASIYISIVYVVGGESFLKMCSYSQSSEINWDYCPSSLMEITLLTEVNIFIKVDVIYPITYTSHVVCVCVCVLSKCQLIQHLLSFWMAKFCLLLVYQTAMMFNENICN